ncbi:hypothetical protein L687_04450 [Microbacterium maritypicum MF109]|uniref:Uncharacterized protein n=1 Tax=Microbacterium maritypicum MF109 TaxID=1333857 RepID=T5KE04_MICMQ|nr:hypothetical protein L687_04450 [Microbacterium maritypicum MF109]
MIAVTTMALVPAVTGVFLRSAAIVAHRRVVMLRRWCCAVFLVCGVMGVLVVLAHRKPLLGCARVEPGADG